MPQPTGEAARLRLRVTAAAETAIRQGHPWVYETSVREQNRPGAAGDLAVVYDRRDRFLALGLFDPDSPLRLRILHTGKPVPVNDPWWRARLELALDRRRHLFDAHSTGHRLIHGESDGWPGLVLDRYDRTLVLKLYLAAWLPRLAELAAWIRELTGAERLVLRLSRNLQARAAEQFSRAEGEVLFGPAVDGPVVFLENGIRFEADVCRGQKTGFFLDQRENRAQVETLAGGRDVLNAFSFSGGFSLYAARGGARSVTDLDLSAHALASARRNFALNQSLPAVAACRHECVQADAFEWLPAARERFDLVMLDPPSLAKREVERAPAIQAYGRLAAAGIGRLRSHGILVAASCSAHVTAEEFFAVVVQAARESRRPWRELARTGHAPDHPATFAEARYLKCVYLEFEPGAERQTPLPASSREFSP